ncbi:hypothetical protein DL765_008431 [Monosporascus sp. GIB2]|nr:hypothetical protein DL765_008431 [Monosporascus sp. GIB2]
MHIPSAYGHDLKSKVCRKATFPAGKYRLGSPAIPSTVASDPILCTWVSAVTAATLPVPLIEGLARHSLGAQEIRLVRDWMPTQRKRTEEAKLWIYQYHNSPESAWNSFYAFAELEFTQADFEVINWWTGHSPGFCHALTMLLIKFLRREGENGQQEICGKRMLVKGLVKENLDGRTRVL